MPEEEDEDLDEVADDDEYGPGYRYVFFPTHPPTYPPTHLPSSLPSTQSFTPPHLHLLLPPT